MREIRKHHGKAFSDVLENGAGKDRFIYAKLSAAGGGWEPRAGAGSLADGLRLQDRL